jgi:hypothetical protein
MEGQIIHKLTKELEARTQVNNKKSIVKGSRDETTLAGKTQIYVDGGPHLLPRQCNAMSSFFFVRI